LRATTQRLACFVLTVFLAALLAASLVRIAPGFGMDERQFDLRLSEGSIEAIAADHHRSGGTLVFFARYLSGLAQGDLGHSVSFGRPLSELLGERLRLTARTVAAGLSYAWLAGLMGALALEYLRRPLMDVSGAALGGVVLCLPSAAVALACFHAGGGPALAIGIILSPRIFRYTRGLLRAAAERPHVLAARARGIEGMQLLGRHIWLPASPEMVALAGVSVNMALGAAIPVEVLCDSPGVGQLVWRAAMARDLPVLVNITVVIAAVTAGANLLSDAARSLMAGEQ
jgi:peptide/nickel transport system permease protein